MIIKNIQLENFKCFRKTDIDFGKITLLTGANSSGKSSFIDAILAVMQTEKFPLYLSPNGKYNDMGGYENISHQYKNENIKLKIEFDAELFSDKKDATGRIINTLWTKSEKSSMPKLNEIKIYNRSLDGDSVVQSFLSEYINNNISQLEKDVGVQRLDEIEKSFNFIGSYRVEPERHYFQVAKSKNRIKSSGQGFAQQIVEWEEQNSDKIIRLTKILKELKLLHSIETKKRDDGTFQILIKIKENSYPVPLTDVGYGVSKILPLLVADLQLGEHSLLAMSEPEIDLHPSVQADFAEYLASQTKNNKQYIVETHSEYIINRLRLLISKDELKEEDVKVYFFENNGIETKTYNVKLKKNGQITDAPDSFFETYEVDTLNIALNSFEDE